MIAAGERNIKRVVVAASPLASPCGACRQFIVEFGADIEIIGINANQLTDIRRWTIGELIPHHFKFEN
jgi:cytidine deaminase